jgi:CBS-domain-containing membrane protein
MTTARDVMSTRPTTISAHAAIADAARLRRTLDLRHLPVVDERGKLVGMLSDRDLKGMSAPFFVPEDIGQKAPEANVSDVMTAGAVSVRPESDVAEVVDLLLENHIGAVPVVDDVGTVAGVVSYVDVLRALPKRGEWRARDIMTADPKTIGMSDSVGDAIEALQTMEVRHLPVVDDHRELVGMISERDLGSWARQFSEGDQARRHIVTLSTVRVADVMSSDVASVEPDADVAEIVETMLERNVGALPVVERDQPVGIVSYVDLLRTIPFPRGR